LGIVASARVGSTFSPADYGNLDLWLAADAITALSDGDPVSTWEDLSTSGYDVTSSSTNRPSYQTGEVNGLPAVLFDGSDDGLTYSGATVVAGSAQTLVAVVKPSGANFGGGILLSSVGDFSAQFRFDSGYMEIWRRNIQEGGNSSIVVGTGWHICTYTYNAGAIAYRIDGAAQGTGSLTNSLHSGDTVLVGCADLDQNGSLPGYIAEMVHYSAVRSAGEIDAVEAYLADKYAITI
jgi:hypothetical protein